MKLIAGLHESPFTFKERLLFAFLAGVGVGAVLALMVAYILERVK